jgi:uncharacterized membrane protein YphA (DoxX/SURF4 family)
MFAEPSLELIALRVLICLFFAVLFVQSGWDKVTDWRGNLEWLKGHFGKTSLAKVVPLLLGTLTLMELATGIVCLVAIVSLFLPEVVWFYGVAMLMCLATFLMLFTGQRIAKDYAGASVIAIYFGVALLAFLFGPTALR